jgi:hypothetical protein
MANNIFDFKKHIKVELGLPTAGVFILGVSVLDGPDVLSAGGGMTYVDTLADVVSVDFSIGFDQNTGFMTQAVPATATIVMQSETYDPNSNRAVHVGTDIRVSYQPQPDTSPLLWLTLFEGKILSYEVAYNFIGTNVITFECADALQSAINTIIPLFTTPSSPSPITEGITALEPYLPGGFVNITGTPWVYTPQYNYTNTTVGQILNELTDAELGMAYLSLDSGAVQFYAYDELHNFITNNPPTLNFSTTHSTDPNHVCINNIVLGASGSDAVNEIKATKKTGGATQTKSNTDSIDLYGRTALEVSVNVSSDNLLTLWLARTSVKNDIRQAKEIGFNPILDSGKFSTGYGLTALFMQTMNIDFNKGGVTFNDDYIISRVTHAITPTDWQVNLELWKGF